MYICFEQPSRSSVVSSPCQHGAGAPALHFNTVFFLLPKHRITMSLSIPLSGRTLAIGNLVAFVLNTIITFSSNAPIYGKTNSAVSNMYVPSAPRSAAFCSRFHSLTPSGFQLCSRLKAGRSRYGAQSSRRRAPGLSGNAYPANTATASLNALAFGGGLCVRRRSAGRSPSLKCR